MKRKPIPVDHQSRPEPVSIQEIRRAQGHANLTRVLLAVCRERLARAVALERECDLPLAETSVILHDVRKLSKALAELTKPKEPPTPPPAPQRPALSLQDILSRQTVDRGGGSRVRAHNTTP